MIDELNQGKFKSIVATGDNIFTAISVAKKSNILKKDKKVIYSNQLELDNNLEEVIRWEFEDA